MIAHEPNGAALLIGSNYDEETELLPPTTPEGLAAYARRRFGAEGDAIASLYTGTDAESAFVAQDRMLSDYAFAASTREADLFSKTGAPAYVYRFTRFARGPSRPRSARSIRPSSFMCSARRRPSIGRGPTATGNCPIRCNAIGRISLRSAIPTARDCRNGRATSLPGKDVMQLGDEIHPIPSLAPERKSAFDAYLATRLTQ